MASELETDRDGHHEDDTTSSFACHLLPDYEDDPSQILASFPEIKRKTTQTLYQQATTSQNTNNKRINNVYAIDKSPKGSVDEPIQFLVDLINHHPSFSTLSSCSGRIALFQPSGITAAVSSEEYNPTIEETVDPELDPNNNDGLWTYESSSSSLLKSTNDIKYVNKNNNSKGTPESGKGRGAWLFVSHETIQASDLLDIFEKNDANRTFLTDDIAHPDDESLIEKTLVVFKMEPMLLHVAAATLERGKQLLNLALSLGFRESGLVLPNKRSHRVTVAIRGVSLSLTVPLAFHGDLYPSKAYLTALIQQANHRMELNQAKIAKLYDSVKKKLFRQSSISTGSLHLRQKILPDLNLWGHDAIAIQHDERTNDVDVLVFGGYGQGPTVGQDNSNKPCQRSGDIYCLQRKQGQWSSQWERIQQKHWTHSEMERVGKLDCLDIDVKPASFSSREGTAIFQFPVRVLSMNSRLIGIYGGRKGPNSALDDLLLYEYPIRRDCFVTPIDVRGNKPAARWGHSLTALEYNESPEATTKRVALLIGGRNDRNVLNSVHLLSIVDSDNQNECAHLMWERITFSSEAPQPLIPFNHNTVAIDRDEDALTFFVFGGLSNTVDLLSSFSNDEAGWVEHEPNLETQNSSCSMFTIPLNAATPCLAMPQAIHISPDCPDLKKVGTTTVLFQINKKRGIPETTTSRAQLLICGGLPRVIHGDQVSPPTFELLELGRIHNEVSDNLERWLLQPSEVNLKSVVELNNTVVVNHRFISIPAQANQKVEAIALGGGVMGFAFGPCFSRSFQVEISYPEDHTISRIEPPGQSVLQQTSLPNEDSSRISSPSPSRKHGHTNVIYVKKQDAKSVKTELETLCLIDKSFRMTHKRDGAFPNTIAVPITEDCLSALSRGDRRTNLWTSWVLGTGQEEMPFSTAHFAKQQK